ncbi:SUMF1/EgtB/PvdO family nonheme iron enzyme [Borrelia miyamotoi]|uniref:SUMF1/EgtB/PvdO family nonheme iron enzyme n=1 Tax=Borrelia miyamotoi TaxID=47466 RepID=A0AAQ3AGA1_9SPIR|nr:SUMF1/EgtB/PvdO family nonheme iron enzyme [Borrelia miyamotoi]AGT27037.1 hypothetical protein I871_00170 [Borrelia miyamotoi LB-2001]AJA58248.1 hypothetical protein RJ61_00155 [Borrelia miyamotoi]AOW95324.1 hypothetical protein AXH25_00155 [Borrelia miyamotoi]QTL83202.1 SUMF1/EgtB/PvdO family nonheme iron enzyme [Borrelia miyamotoi]WAZ85512.1 SUMF1/EgtB/PvdO family nonheme iron enzyme [Borrelia miyamotoi]
MLKENGSANIKKEALKVKLKPILGITPKVYVFFIIIILPLMLLFSLIINNKLKNPGAYLKINTNINNAHVYLDEKYIGRTPLNKYTSATKGTLKIQRLGFETYEKKIEIQNSLFTSYKFNIDLELKDPNKIIAQRQKELSVMTKIKNTNENIKLIPVFSLLLNDFKNHPAQIKKFFKSSIPYLNSNEIFKDFLKVYTNIYLIKNNNNKEIWESLQKNFNLESRSIIWFFENLDKEQQKQISKETWFKALIEKLKNENKILKVENKSINLYLNNFKKIPSQNIESVKNYKLYSQNLTLKTTYNLKEFLIQNRNVTKAEYQNFLNENPKWTLNNKDNLIKEELVDESYLKTFKQMSSNEDITNISYHAAMEYAKWYSSSLPKGFKARLPISQEWELYQKEVPRAINSLNVNEISKKVGFWNLMQNSSFNETLLFQSENDIYSANSNFNSLITEIRTYNYHNNAILKPSIKASFFKNWSYSPNIGFRLVIEKE